ncbi:MAG: tetratricopeptide repeat protein [Phycisphaerae bacterium]|nr:tetratricopeptide repeat protein [Phycisphaerae bacterium]
MNERIETIRALLEKEPRDVFLHYSLGKELTAAGDFDGALEAFAECTRLEEDYLPARVEAGKCLRAAGRLGEARRMFEAALAAAEAHDEPHTADAVRQQLEGLSDGNHSGRGGA